jgi:sugar-specific transcriptional regulator TrmB
MPQFGVLQQLGLSKSEINCYKTLLSSGPATTRQLAQCLKTPQTNVYGSLNSLAEHGFVKKVKLTTKPTLFIARPLRQALPEHYMYQRRVVLKLCLELKILPPPALPPGLYKKI